MNWQLTRSGDTEDIAVETLLLRIGHFWERLARHGGPNTRLLLSDQGTQITSTSISNVTIDEPHPREQNRMRMSERKPVCACAMHCRRAVSRDVTGRNRARLLRWYVRIRSGTKLHVHSTRYIIVQLTRMRMRNCRRPVSRDVTGRTRARVCWYVCIRSDTKLHSTRYKS